MGGPGWVWGCESHSREGGGTASVGSVICPPAPFPHTAGLLCLNVRTALPLCCLRPCGGPRCPPRRESQSFSHCDWYHPPWSLPGSLSGPTHHSEPLLSVPAGTFLATEPRWSGEDPAPWADPVAVRAILSWLVCCLS